MGRRYRRSLPLATNALFPGRLGRKMREPRAAPNRPEEGQTKCLSGLGFSLGFQLSDFVF